MMNSPSRWICLLSRLRDVDARVPGLQLVGVDQDRLVAHVLRTLDKHLRVLRLDEGLHFSRVAAADAVPELGPSGVEAVDAAEVVVLGVEGEHRPEPADVEVGRVDPVEGFLAEPVTAKPTPGRRATAGDSTARRRPRRSANP